MEQPIKDNKKYNIVFNLMKEYAPIRAKIPNAGNGHAIMSCLILDDHYCLLCGWL